jgi:transposase
MASKSTFVMLTDQERSELERISRSTKEEKRLVERAEIILLCDQGLTNEQIAETKGIRAATASKWRVRYSKDRLRGLADSPRSGKPPKYDDQLKTRILSKLDEPPPKGYSTWNGGLLAKALGDVSDAKVWRILRASSISLARRKSWCVSTDPEFAAKAADVVALYLNPPENAMVICVDEKPGIQALERSQGWLKMPDGKSLKGFSHEYKRNGTSNLFAALEVATGMVKAGHFKRKTRGDFLAFMDEVLADVPEQREVHVILDNYATHKNLPESWTEKHPNVIFHYTPTHASWLNQIETWFSILWRGALRGASFKSAKHLCKAIDEFIEAYNQTAHPFQWKRATTKPKTLSHSYAN